MKDLQTIEYAKDHLQGLISLSTPYPNMTKVRKHLYKAIIELEELQKGKIHTCKPEGQDCLTCE